MVTSALVLDIARTIREQQNSQQVWFEDVVSTKESVAEKDCWVEAYVALAEDSTGKAQTREGGTADTRVSSTGRTVALVGGEES